MQDLILVFKTRGVNIVENTIGGCDCMKRADNMLKAAMETPLVLFAPISMKIENTLTLHTATVMSTIFFKAISIKLVELQMPPRLWTLSLKF
jgi:hypothetical protein